MRVNVRCEVPRQIELEVISHRKVALDHYEMELPRIAPFEDPAPGQFLNVACRDGGSLDPLLRRPFSFYRLTQESFSFIYRVVGRGTARLAKITPGCRVDVVGPLGSGYRLDDLDGEDRALLVGGGVGVPPLFHLSQELRRRAVAFEVAVGFASESYAIGVDDWEAVGVDARVATDDGSRGYRGFVTHLVRERLEAGGVTRIFACGPRPMLQAVSRLAVHAGIDVQVAMEEWMGCGVGACLSCVCPVKEAGGVTLARICREGPVFDGSKVVWPDVQ